MSAVLQQLQQLDPMAVRVVMAAAAALVVAIFGCAAFGAAERRDGRR